jgi:hypothetical protein
MKKTMLFVQLMWLTVFGAFAQITFETLPMDTAYWNGSEQSGFFRDGNYRLMNSYDDSWGVWSGFAYSKMTDTVTTGWINQYSVMAGAGADGSEKFALAYAYSPVGIKLEEADTVDGFYVTNSTYAYLSMRDGDAYAKKFGGDSGDDADWFKLTVKGWNGGTQTDSVDFYLADYRFSDNTQDYILKDWKFVDLSSLGFVDSLTFELSSSDTGAYGMNTPSYFCLDNLSLGEKQNTKVITEQPTQNILSVYPNPTSDYVVVRSESPMTQIKVFDISGKLYVSDKSSAGMFRLNLSNVPAGVYFLQVKTNGQVITKRIVKK